MWFGDAKRHLDLERDLEKIDEEEPLLHKDGSWASAGCIIAGTIIALFVWNAVYGSVMLICDAKQRFAFKDEDQVIKKVVQEHIESQPVIVQPAITDAKEKHAWTENHIMNVANRTLGFQKILGIGAPDRHGQREAFSFQASLTGFDVDWMEDFAHGKQRGSHGQAHLSSMHQDIHLGAIKTVLENQFASALILEDDTDWDVRLLSQMVQLARGTRAVSGIDSTMEQSSPYGDDWDVIWPGHCGEILQPATNEKVRTTSATSSTHYIIQDDKTVPMVRGQPWANGLDIYPPHTRVVHSIVSNAPSCTFAYAVSARGAQKILDAIPAGQLGTSPLPFDRILGNLCTSSINASSSDPAFKCISVQPMLFIRHNTIELNGEPNGIPIMRTEVESVEAQVPRTGHLGTQMRVTGQQRRERERPQTRERGRLLSEAMRISRKGFQTSILQSARLSTLQLMEPVQ